MLSEFRLALLLLREGNLQMMSWNGFMQGEGFHLPFRPRTQVIGVHEITAGAAGSGRAGLVVGCGLRGSFEIRNDANAVGQARQLSEEVRELRVDLLRDNAIAVHQIIRLIIEKTRVSPQKFRKVMEVTFESRQSDDFVHFGTDSLHCGKTDVMNLL